MIKKEWKELLHSKWLKIVMIAILIIPCAYVCIFLGSMWDPYGNTKDIPVAVVNHDQKVSYENEMLDVGNDLVKNLEDSDAMKFQCVDEEEAEKGLEDGKYYMVITIPKDFSSNATTLLDEKPKNINTFFNISMKSSKKRVKQFFSPHCGDFMSVPEESFFI